jgi:23S rRNA-/tRNA-specific pseudouridylate synthase
VKRAVAIVCERSCPVEALLVRLGDGASAALSDGRIFIGRRRARMGDRVVAGEQVVMHAAREGSASVLVLGERDGIVAAYKPAPVASVADHHGRKGSLGDALAVLLGPRARRLTPTSRLDVGVSGVVLFATEPLAQARLALAREEGRYRRRYVAIAARAPAPAAGVWSFPIGRGADPRLREVSGRDARPAVTRYSVVESAPGGAAMLAVEPQTGRTHQIRVHASHAGAPLFGDIAYRGPGRVVVPSGAVFAVRRIALHAAWVEVPLHDGKPWRVEAPLPDDLTEIWQSLSGAAAAWAKATLEW